MPELVFFRRGEEVLRFHLQTNRVVIGRGEQSDVVIPDPAISRQQVALVRAGAGYAVEDLSGSGTLVCGAARADGPLGDGEDITLGQWRAIFRDQTTADTDAASTRIGTRTELKPDAETARTLPAQLRVVHGGRDEVFRIGASPLTLGKDADNTVVLEDRFLSGKHLRITRRDALFHVADLASTNGTWLGGARVWEVEVPFHTTFTAGSAQLSIEPVPPRGTSQRAIFHGIIGSDPSIAQLTEMIRRVAASNAAVTVLGESGTGKELVAQALHADSPRQERPFIPINCAAISRELIESELFGHEKGAFTGAQSIRRGAFEEADGGTLFLDEIGELPLELQAKLLRALESGEIKRVGAARPSHVDVRVVCATNRDLLARVQEGHFREDLYYRLCVVPLHLPPLRSRRADIPALANHFLERFAPAGQQVCFTPAAIAKLQSHAWPGNIRELRNVVHRALLLRTGLMLDAPDLTFDSERVAASPGQPGGAGYVPGMGLEELLAKAERQIVEGALRRYNNNRERVARELKVARSTLFKKLKDWGMTRQEETDTA